MSSREIKLNLDQNKALATLCKRSFYRFFIEFWSEQSTEELSVNWHLKYICDELQKLAYYVVNRLPKPYDLFINVPPGTSKSSIVTQSFNAWLWTQDASLRVISSSYSNALSLSHSVKTRDIVNSDKYKKLFPEVELKRDEQSKSDFKTTKGGQRYTTSTGGTVTGMHGHIILVDDPINPQQSSSDKERERANEFCGTTLASRKIDKKNTPMVYVMQRLHESDPTGIMLVKKGKNIKHIKLPAELTEKTRAIPEEVEQYYEDGLLDPRRLGREVLDEALIDLGSYGYAGQFSQNPAPDDGGYLKRDWFRIIEWDQEFSRLEWNFTADTAYTEDESNDPSGYLSYARRGADYIIRYAQTEFLEFPELCRALKGFAELHGYTHRSIIKVEPKASGKSLVQTLKKNTDLNIKEGKSPNTDKVARVKDSAPVCESGRVFLIRGPWNKDFLDQLTTFPNAAHDEYIDCLTMMIGNGREKLTVKRTN